VTTAPQPGSDRIAGLTAYFGQHRHTFTRQALTAAAASAGYTATEIDTAWALAGWGSAESAVSALGGPPNFGLAVVVAILFVAGTYVGAVGLLSNAGTRDGALPGFLTALLGGALAWAGLRSTNPAVARGIGCGVVIAITLPVVLFLVILGVCVAAGYNPPF
jgi:hypothetical protein